MSEKEKKVNIHNSSVVIARNEDSVQSTVSRANKLKSIVNNLPFDWLAYEELSRLYYSVQIRSVTALSSVATALMAGPCLSYEHSCLRLKSSRERKGLYFSELHGTCLNHINGTKSSKAIPQKIGGVSEVYLGLHQISVIELYCKKKKKASTSDV